MPECVGNYSIPTANGNVEGVGTLAGAGMLNFLNISHNRPPLTLNLLTTSIVAPPSNASKWQMGFNSVFKGLMPLIVLLIIFSLVV
jgi:hypothetical protein